jgi:nitric oxide reductase subunit B
MEQLNNKLSAIPKRFLYFALLLFSLGILFGLLGALQYIFPNFLKPLLSFERVRPLHVSSVVFWIIIAAVGSVLTYLQEYTNKSIFSVKLAKLQFGIFAVTVLLIIISYCNGMFGGREYWEFDPILALPIIFAWILFLINFIKSIKSLKNQPVYVWMWFTGIVFFLFTFLESYLWIFPYFRNNIINDMTIQWKSYGSMVGAWNMMIYGSSIFLMEKISGDKKYSHSTIAFVLYFTGLFNLMFNWGHHIYTLPTHNFIKHISYIVSMTELFILGKIIWQWKSTLTTAQKHFNRTAYRFIIAADVWVFVSLSLAIAMSIPAINVYTHGTHFTVAHTMGTTIGINSFLLLAFVFDILENKVRPYSKDKQKIKLGFWIVNISLFAFWICLMSAGVIKAKWQMSESKIPFNQMMENCKPFFKGVFDAGFLMAIGFVLLLYALAKNIFINYLQNKIDSEENNI